MGEEDGRNTRPRNWAPPLAPRGVRAPSPITNSLQGARGIRAPSPSAPSPRGPRSSSPGMASSSQNRGQPTLANMAFPPQLEEAQRILDITPARPADGGDFEASGAEVKALRRWRDELLQLLAAVSSTSSSGDAPVEEVWHWLAANERLTRSIAFVENASVCDVVQRVVDLGGQESEEVVNRWRDAIKQLRQLQKESGWNSQYLRVVEDPLRQLSAEEVICSGSLPGLIKRLLRSLHRVFHSSDYYKEHRMAPLLHKILKELVKQAGRHVPTPYEVSKPKAGVGAAIRAAGQMQESFQAFAEGFFITHSSSGSGTDRRPATAQGTAADRSSSNSRRKDPSSDLGWWRATARTSLEQAEHCRMVSDRILRLLEATKTLVGYLPSLRSRDPELVQQVESFIELYGGVKGGGDMEALLDLKRRLEADEQIREVQDRIQFLISRAEAAGARYQDVPEHTLVTTEEGGMADVLTLTGQEDDQPLTCEGIQDDITNLREDLRQFGSQLENLSAIVKQKNSQIPLSFTPLPRSAGQELTPSGEVEERSENAREVADKVAALEVAKRSTWYKGPQSCVPDGTDFISVRQTIEVTPITVLSDRPRSSHPCLVARPATAPALRGGRPTSSRQAVVAQRLGYSTLDEQGLPTHVIPERLQSVAVSSSFPNCLDEDDPSKGPIMEAIDSSGQESRQSEKDVNSREMPRSLEGCELSTLDSELHVLHGTPEIMDSDPEIIDSDVDPFCNAAVSWSIK